MVSISSPVVGTSQSDNGKLKQGSAFSIWEGMSVVSDLFVSAQMVSICFQVAILRFNSGSLRQVSAFDASKGMQIPFTLCV